MQNADNLTGTVLNDRYEVSDKIGTGGMATVYKAHDKVLDRDVAVKILRDNYDDNSEIVSNFIKEARSSASLVHPNVVSVYDVGEYDGINYMVMELVDGKTLKSYITENQRLPWQEACDYAIQIGQGIQAAHESGIIHRDIKPQNIIMAPGGVLKVTDFGIAKAMESDKSMAGGTATGSVHYISPEQARGGFTDFRSDIYSLGIVLYEMLAGRVPFDGDSPVSVALMHIEEEAINVKCVNMDIPADLAYITMKAMNRDPGKRYQHMQELLDDLRAVLADETLPSREEEGTVVEPEPIEDDFDIDIDEPIKKEDMTGSGRNNTRKKTKVKKKRRAKHAERNAVIFALSTVIALVLVAAGVVMIMIGKSSNPVPDFTNMTLDAAKALAAEEGYTISAQTESALSDNVAVGCVIMQTPAAGAKISKDQPIELVLSLGASGGDILVDDYSHMSVDEVTANLDAMGITYNTIFKSSTDVEMGYIIRQLPLPGTHINAINPITLYVSSGRAIVQTTVPVPELKGTYVDSVEAKLQSCGLSVGTVTKVNSDSPEGMIVGQSPQPGETVDASTAVSVEVSGGSAAYTAPDVNEPDTQIPAVPEPAGAAQPASGVYEYKIKIPDDAGDRFMITVVVNGKSEHNQMHSRSEAKNGTITVEISLTGEAAVQAYVDNKPVDNSTVTPR